ncbi:deoxyribonuclease TATDN1 [Neocloeon triangulifer]|uniref:deoxyribonuclease TATDN1 n=1 Tax=Neocloeon triangulifer TaxID=2078957 RepID=UPI00286F613E|nr:deoxyribonuclease TATDN1 [Neocloeon triangulifer]
MVFGNCSKSKQTSVALKFSYNLLINWINLIFLCMRVARNLSKMLIDIGANLTDGMYKGIYNGTKRHEPDLPNVLKRAWDAGLKHIIVTGGSLEESREALDMVQIDDRLSCTVGVHPTRCGEFEKSGDPGKYLQDLEQLIKDGGKKVAAFGEFGLDYERTQFCDKETQMKYLKMQLEVASKFPELPLFLHCRKSAKDLADVLFGYKLKGVVHSFDGTFEEAQELLNLGYFIGINGCSLKTSDNLETVKKLPLDRILLETDAPWCEVRPSHAGHPFIKSKPLPSVKKEKWVETSMVKSRNEPCTLRHILEIVSQCRDEEINFVEEEVYKNTLKLFSHID